MLTRASVSLGLAACLLAPALYAQESTPTLAQLRAGFREPPPEARLRCYWWWLNGNTDTVTITHDLEEMKAKGFGGALLVDADGSSQNGHLEVPAGPRFGSPAWTKLYVHALREADRLGLEITLNITSGWNLGGPTVTPEQASKILTWTRMQVKGGTTVSVKLPEPERKNGFYRQIAVLAYPLQHGAALATPPKDPFHEQPGAGENNDASQALRFRTAAAETGFSMPDTSALLNAGGAGYADTAESGVQNVTDKVASDGTLSWEAPAGEWEVLRMGYTDSDAQVSTASQTWRGLAIDYMSREAFEQFWSVNVEPLVMAAKPFHSLKYLASDSWELGGTNWTAEFRAQFERLRGYDPVPWLPVVAGRIVGDRDRSTRFLNDLRRTIADLVVSEHYDVFAAEAAKHGLGIEAESGGPHGAPLDALETFRHAAVPQTEFWSTNPHRPKDPDRFFTKEAASAAHIYGQRFVAQEGETSIGPQWSESLATDLKPAFDMASTEGMNRLVWHEFTSSPAATGLPGQEYFAGTHLNPKVTWWNAGTPFFTYLNRVQYMLQQGTPVSDLLYFYGDHVPNFVRLKAEDPAHVLPGYDYDVTNQDALLRTIEGSDGSLHGPAGVTWRALALPKTGRVSMAVLTRIAAYVRAGGIVIGPAPTSPTGMESEADKTRFDELVHTVWGAGCADGSHHAYGSGQVFCTRDAHAAFSTMKLAPDFATEPATAPDVSSTSELDYIHRRVGDADLYFVRNGSKSLSRHEVIFRAEGRLPERWDAVTGETETASDYKLLPDGRVQMNVELPPFGSAFYVFARRNDAPAISHALPKTVAVEVKQPWSVSFQAGRGAPSGPVAMPALSSWSESSESGVRYFSGTATYRAPVTAPAFAKGRQVWIRFGDVREIAHVKVNGRDAGAVWAKPLMLRVDPFLTPGENTLEIEVTNLWPNRIIGDLQPGTTTRYTRTNIKSYQANSPLLPSGLIGPVEWVIE
jgi:hypothetical protein